MANDKEKDEVVSEEVPSNGLEEAGASGVGLSAFIESMPELIESDADTIAAEMFERIMAAETIEDVLKDQGLTDAVDVLDMSLRISGVRFNKSTFAEGSGYYAVISARKTVDNEAVTVGCGAARVVMQLAKLAQLKAYPCVLVIRRADKPSSKGFFPMWMEPGVEGF